MIAKRSRSEEEHNTMGFLLAVGSVWDFRELKRQMSQTRLGCWGQFVLNTPILGKPTEELLEGSADLFGAELV